MTTVRLLDLRLLLKLRYAAKTKRHQERMELIRKGGGGAIPAPVEQGSLFE